MSINLVSTYSQSNTVHLLLFSKVKILTLLDAFGLIAVTLMLVFYTLEERNNIYVLAFAGACVLGSGYGFLQGAWPFGVIEAVWALVALRRWKKLGRSIAGI